MIEALKRIRLLYVVLAVLLLVGLLPLALAGTLLSRRSADELRAIEGRYQAQLVRDKARQIELYGQRYRDVVVGLSRAFEIAGGDELHADAGYDSRLQKSLQDDPNLLALAICPVKGEVHRAFQVDLIKREEVDQRIADSLARISGRGVIIGRPQVIRSAGEIAVTIAAPVMNGEDIVAAVVAVVSFQEAFKAVQQPRSSKSAQELLDAGLPVLFVVDQNGRVVAHPDPALASSERSMTELRVVREWLETGAQVQSALAPFTLDRNGKSTPMLGSYATVELDRNTLLGVIAMQDESAALASVGDMRTQTMFVSLIAAALALLIGFFFADKLTRPVRELADGAQRIAAGDFSQRVKIYGRTELADLGSSFNQMTDQIERFVGDLQRSAAENREMFLGTVKALAAAIDGKDPYTRGHSERVSRFSVATAQALGLPLDDIEKIRVSALLHDVGKIGIDDRVLKKPAALDDEEFELMKTHPQKGYKIMSQIPAMKEFLPGMYMHHEMINGQGYPQGLQGEEIPMQARVVSVADTFDAMTTERPYQRAMDLEAALTRLKSFVGTRYDARVVAAFIAACEAGKIRPGVTRVNRNQSEFRAIPSVPLSSATDSVIAIS
ncbi:MAG TPA: HD domain-containing phosphohydrolase [Pyrinomonadaceae bacterium]|nr:HD domain-containing phosphohydrolase [Pyrinomonadaceae bacterium]